MAITTKPSPTLLQFLQNEIRSIDAAPTPAEAHPTSTDLPKRGLRVPIELDGALWSAEVEHVDRKQLRLIVDRQAVAEPLEAFEAAIQYQPENGAMHRTSGKVTSGGFLPENRVRLNFDLR